MTLTFVPKIVTIFLVVTLTGSFIGGQFYLFTENVYGRIEHGFER
jgi:flagellar biosynthetic protein FliQ